MGGFGDPRHLVPSITTDGMTMLAGGNIFDGLLDYTFSLEPRPRLAESWDISTDGLTYTFHLVRNALWHDNVTFTSADVKFTYEEALAKYHPRASVALKKCLDKIETPDAYTVIFKLKFPYAPFIYLHSTTEGAILPKHLLEGRNLLNDSYISAPIGTGPFIFVEWVKGDHITLKKNENYWKKGQPYLDRIVIKIVPDANARVLAFDKGEIDYLWHRFLPDSEIIRLNTTSGVKVTNKGSVTGSLLQMIWINLRRPILQNVKVRQAIAYTIDKPFINDVANYMIWTPSIAAIASESIYQNPNVPIYGYNLTKAGQLLDEAGYPRGQDGTRFELTIDYVIGTPNTAKTAEIMKNALQQVGVKLKLQPSESAAMTEKTQIRWDFDLIIHSIGTSVDPAIGISRMYSSTNIKKEAWANVVGYNNSRVDWLLDKAEREMNVTKRKEYYFEFQTIVANELPYIPLFELQTYAAFKTTFVGLHTWAAYSQNSLAEVWWALGELPPKGPDIFMWAIVAAVAGVLTVSVVTLVLRRRRKIARSNKLAPK
jgi:peptide/nickel transport system substrate-binding protein